MASRAHLFPSLISLPVAQLSHPNHSEHRSCVCSQVASLKAEQTKLIDDAAAAALASAPKDRSYYSTTFKKDTAQEHGVLPYRVVHFTKKQANSAMRFLYSDNFRNLGSNTVCSWNFKIDGQKCSQDIISDLYSSSGRNEHRPGMLMGYCTDVSVGDHVLTVEVDGTWPGRSNADCHTGWGADFFIEAQEVGEGGNVHFVTPKSPAVYGDAVGPVTGRQLVFTKKEASSRVKIFYSDNLRTLTHSGVGNTCGYEIKMDGQKCAGTGIDGRTHHPGGDNAHITTAITGVCEGSWAAGEHTITVHQYESSGDCYVGWYTDGHTGDLSVFTLEAEEIPANDPFFHYESWDNVWGDDAGNAPAATRSLIFTKVYDSSRMRLTWYCALL